MLPECIDVPVNVFEDIRLGYERHEKQKEWIFRRVQIRNTGSNLEPVF